MLFSSCMQPSLVPFGQQGLQEPTTNVDNSAACLSVPFPYNPTFLNVGRSLLLAIQISIGDMRVCGCFGRH